MRKYHLVLLVTLIFTLLILVTGVIRRELAADLLVYKLDNFNGKPSSLNLYDPASGLTAPLIPNGGFGDYSLSAKGRLAYAWGENNQRDIFIWDLQALGQKPVNITQTQEVNEGVLGWSPDGRYKAFKAVDKSNHMHLYLWNGETAQDITPHDIPGNVVVYGTDWSPDSRYLAVVSYNNIGNVFVYVWDGEKVIDILHDSAKSYRAVWSLDGRLAFNVNLQLDTPSEIYLWDGHRTLNLSQSPLDGEGAPVWSADGKLAFMSERNGESVILVWDGVSLKNGAPDKDSFVSVAPGMIGYHSVPGWTPQGQVVFISQAAQDTHTQIYVWDGERAINISQNPTLHNGIPVWSRDGRWAFGTFFSQAQLLYVRDGQGRTLLTTEGQAAPAWSSNGYLMFCTGGWTLSVWNGQSITEVGNAREINARWQSGEGVNCSSG